MPPDAYEMIAALSAMAMGIFCLVKLSQSPICKVLAQRISGDSANGRMADLEENLERLEEQVLDYQERMDFAERMIARGGGSPSPADESAWEATPEAGLATPV
jgi:hypothetical protein